MSNITEKIQNFMKSLETREEFCEVAQYLLDNKYEETLKGFVDFKLSNKPVETTNEEPKYKLTLCTPSVYPKIKTPFELVRNNEVKWYSEDSIPWIILEKIMLSKNIDSHNQLLEFVWNNYKNELSPI